MKVTAKATRSGEWWAVMVPEVPGAFTQVKRLEQVGAMAADAVATLLEIPIEDIEVTLAPVLMGSARQRVAKAKQASEQAVEAQQAASTAMRRAVAELRREGLTVRDAARILGVSHQRVAQLEKD